MWLKMNWKNRILSGEFSYENYNSGRADLPHFIYYDLKRVKKKIIPPLSYRSNEKIIVMLLMIAAYLSKFIFF